MLDLIKEYCPKRICNDIEYHSTLVNCDDLYLKYRKSGNEDLLIMNILLLLLMDEYEPYLHKEENIWGGSLIEKIISTQNLKIDGISNLDRKIKDIQAFTWSDMLKLSTELEIPHDYFFPNYKAPSVTWKEVQDKNQHIIDLNKWSPLIIQDEEKYNLVMKEIETNFINNEPSNIIHILCLMVYHYEIYQLQKGLDDIYGGEYLQTHIENVCDTEINDKLKEILGEINYQPKLENKIELTWSEMLNIHQTLNIPYGCFFPEKTSKTQLKIKELTKKLIKQ